MRRGTGNRKPNAKDDAATKERNDRRAEAWRLRWEDGLSYRQIAAQLKVSLATIAKDMAAMREPCKPSNADELRAEASETLLLIRDRMFEVAHASGDPQAANAAVKAIHEFSQLNGLHAPEKLQVEAAATVSVDSARAAMAAAFGSKVLPEPGKPE